MSVTQDIVASYRAPRQVVRRLLAMGEREDRAFAILMAACAVIFVSRWPALARQAHFEQIELNPLLGGSLFALLFMLPLCAYIIAFVTHLVLKVVGRKQSAFGARISLFWAMIATGPLYLLVGLVEGFMGEGVALTIVGAVWFAVFMWIWISGLIEAGRVNA
ncbi:YIP1 family protein [Shimia sp. R10_1]|uniref:YIP1 family protein n=1 Tax=Shimia sp. R10_1 TaxID=2821095 RepID=UPI001ADBBE01|nr:YIP1 family protein [Shimia sp. R10_1]MBO9472121.1 YIP1 family protein [Shimia sp. R10_1]